MRELAEETRNAREDSLEVLTKNIPKIVGALYDRMVKELLRVSNNFMRVADIPIIDVRLKERLARGRDENIKLVEKARRAYAEDVREIFSRPENIGKRWEDLKAELKERGRVSESRAELIARDQTLKLNAQITQTRMENAGVERYTWSTSRDERVRPEHAELEGKEFAWNNPPDVGHPGEDFQCRCVAIPII